MAQIDLTPTQRTALVSVATGNAAGVTSERTVKALLDRKVVEINSDGDLALTDVGRERVAKYLSAEQAEAPAPAESGSSKRKAREAALDRDKARREAEAKAQGGKAGAAVEAAEKARKNGTQKAADKPKADQPKRTRQPKVEGVSLRIPAAFHQFLVDHEDKSREAVLTKIAKAEAGASGDRRIPVTAEDLDVLAKAAEELREHGKAQKNRGLISLGGGRLRAIEKRRGELAKS